VLLRGLSQESAWARLSRDALRTVHDPVEAERLAERYGL
jgi:hypothetical protein